jgi:hypothetical protein
MRSVSRCGSAAAGWGWRPGGSATRERPGRRSATGGRPDELFPRDDCLRLFDLLASQDKTLHANPGGHLRVPRAELGGAAHFLRRRLGSDNSASGDNSGDTGVGNSNSRASGASASSGAPVSPVVLAGVRYYVRRVPSPGDARWASVGLDV